MDTSSLKNIPNVFYDLLVFVVPTCQLIIGVWLGVYDFDFNIIKSINLPTSIFLIVLMIVFSYEYGRIAEALSAILVQQPLKFLNKHKIFFSNEDFLKKRENIYDVLGLEKPYDGRDGDKWAIYMYAFSKKPAIGADLLKRYAWEKLSRNSAFTNAILLFISSVRWVYLICIGNQYVWYRVQFGSLLYTICCLLLVLLTYTEYYKRNVWNYDLLTKILPILMDNQKNNSGDKNRNSQIRYIKRKNYTKKFISSKKTRG